MAQGVVDVDALEREKRVNSTWRTLVAVVAIVGLAAGALALIWAFSPPPPGRDLSRAKPTAKALYLAEFQPESGAIVQGQMQNWLLTLKTPAHTPVADAQIEITGGMPDHNHGLPTQPEATTYLGEGRYRIEGVKFTMTGWWEMRFAISGAPGTDAVVFNLML